MDVLRTTDFSEEQFFLLEKAEWEKQIVVPFNWF